MESRKDQAVKSAVAKSRELRELHGATPAIRLTVYDSDEDLRFFRPEDGPNATASVHREINRAVASALIEDGFTSIKFVTLNSEDYLEWLRANGKINNASNRAKWTGLF
jgi:hypothetical protein